MDLPWNPAVLEQRIGRVHRLGQKQPVRVVNFVAQGTIEEGMLSVLKFKKSLFAGVLDGGEKEVFLGGSRLNKFMETVESATAAIPEAMLEDAEDALRAPPDELAGARPIGERSGKRRRRQEALVPAGVVAEPEDEAPQRPAAADPWAGLIQTGMALLQQFVAAAQQGKRPAIEAPGSATPVADSADRPRPACPAWLAMRIPARATFGCRCLRPRWSNKCSRPSATCCVGSRDEGVSYSLSTSRWTKGIDLSFRALVAASIRGDAGERRTMNRCRPFPEGKDLNRTARFSFEARKCSSDA